MLKFVWDWFSSKWPVYPLKHMLLDEEIPGGASFAYTTGAAILTMLTLQLASGVIQLFYYVPAVDHAYDSVGYLRTEVPFGWLVHNMHFWGANLMVVLVALHMVRVYIWGGYKTQLTWLIGVGLLIMTMAMTFTGAPLIWDQKGYWSGEVGSSITGTAPVFGGIMKTILRGGETMGQPALSRFFVIHIALIIPALLLLIGAHVASFRKSGIVGPWKEERMSVRGQFWPDQVFKDMIVASTMIFVVIVLCVFAPPAFTGPADPLNTTYLPKPEWNFLFLYQSLKYFKGPLEPVGTAGVPTVLIALLVFLPFIDRNPERNPAQRPVAMASLALYAGLIVTLTLIGYFSPGYTEMPAAAAPSTASSKTSSSQPTGDRRGFADLKATASALPGANYFKQDGCSGCHSVFGEGGRIGPELSGQTLTGRDRKWLTEQLINPKAHFPNTVMPSFSNLPEQHISAIVDYLAALAGDLKPQAQKSDAAGKQPMPPKQSDPQGSDVQKDRASSMPLPAEVPAETAAGLPGRAAFTIGDDENGALLFKENCVSCHGPLGAGGIANPGSDEKNVPALNPIDADLFSTDPLIFARNIDIFLQHGGTPPGSPLIKMPAFGDSHSLTQQEIANLEAYILKLNKVDRAKLLSPGMQPFQFFILSLCVYGFAALLIGGIWSSRYRRRSRR